MCRESIVIRLTHPYIPLYSNLFYSTLFQSWPHTAHPRCTSLIPWLRVWLFRDTLQGAYLISMAWTSHQDEDDETVFLHLNTVQFSSFSTKWSIEDDFTLVAFSLASVYLVVLFSTCTCTVFKLQLVLCSSFTQSINHPPINQSIKAINRSILPLSQLVDTFDSSRVFPLGFPPSVSASASQQPARWEKYRTRGEGTWEGRDWTGTKQREREGGRNHPLLFTWGRGMGTYRKLWLCLSELGLICVVGFHRCVQLVQNF